ncbi:ras-related protein Rab-28-like [Pieris napi]|uniref:ras-related protein Rab-28-like n=1 Tax=Pieris napi TaxID=78633 RepID=UPI001FBB9204|nr:ras-related protein Rab-28-like [Pieris napi]
MSDNEDDVQGKTIKITLVGDPGTGKTSLCNRYLGGTGTTSSTHGAEVTAGQCLGLRPPIPLQLCDVAGNALNTPMLTNYLYASDIIIFVYDLTNLQSFENLDKWITSVNEINKDEVKKPLMALFGNKSDLEHQRAVRLSSVQKFSSQHLLDHFKGSSRTGEMVNDAFTTVVARVQGTKARLILAPDRKSPFIYESPKPNDQAGFPLIMNRKALRKHQRKESSVCVLQ